MGNQNENLETGLQKSGTESTVANIAIQQTVIGTNAAKLAEILMENIQKVKDDPKYIAQAESVNSQVKSMIDLGKSEIEMFKLQAFISSR